MSLKIKAKPTTALYRKPRKGPIRQGELRSKMWRFDLDGDGYVPSNSSKWEDRCSRYWKLQERLYGIKLTKFAMNVDNDLGIVSTYCFVHDILPGERTALWSRVRASIDT